MLSIKNVTLAMPAVTNGEKPLATNAEPVLGLKEGLSVEPSTGGKIVPCHDDELNLQERLSLLERSGMIKKRSTVSGSSPEPISLEGVDIQQMLQLDRNKSDVNE